MLINVFRIAQVRPHQYEAFRGLVKDAPATLDEWLTLMNKRRLEEAQQGATIREMQVDTNRLARYLLDTGKAHNTISLMHFLAETDPNNGRPWGSGNLY